MTNHFKPLVPVTHKGKAAFSISNRGVSRVRGGGHPRPIGALLSANNGSKDEPQPGPSRPSSSRHHHPNHNVDRHPKPAPRGTVAALAPPPAPSELPVMPILRQSSAMDSGIYARSKKPCNCTKSMCLKLYCDCFANGEFCNGCNCQNCHNDIQHESERSRSIKSCLERNPFAFHPKIGKTVQGSSGAHHAKGCHCKRSGCLKNYCECYEAKIACSALCKCVGCRNYSNTQSTLHALADVAEVRHAQQSSAEARFTSQLQYLSAGAPAPPTLAALQLNLDCMSLNLIAATTRCMISAGSHAVNHYFSIETIEKAIIEEFGQCLNKIIEKSMKQ